MNSKESDNMECPNCNKIYDDDFKFCPYCGEKKPDPMVCINCHSEYYAEYSFCPECGVELITKEEFNTLEEEYAIVNIEENRKRWKINQLKELSIDKEELDKIINQEIEKIEQQIDRELEEEEIKKNKQISFKLDDIDKIKFLKQLPSIENRLNAICINPGSNPCYFVRELKEDEILDMIISDGELFLIDKVDFGSLEASFYTHYWEYDLNRGKYFEDIDEYEYEIFTGIYTDSITGICYLSAETGIDEKDIDLSEYYELYKYFKEQEEEKRRKEEEERKMELERIRDKEEFLTYLENNADRYIEFLGVSGYSDIRKRIRNNEILNWKTFYEIENSIEKQIAEGTYNNEISEDEALEIKKIDLYCYVKDLRILAEGSSVNEPVREELRRLISNGELSTREGIDSIKDILIKEKLNEIKANFYRN